MHTRHSFPPILCDSYKQRLYISRGKSKNVPVKAYELTSLIRLNIFPVLFYPQWLPVVKWFILFAKNHKLEIKRKMSSLWGHIPTKFSSIDFLCMAFARRKTGFVCICILRAMWWHGHPKVLSKEFASCSNSVKSDNQRVTMSVECKLHFLTHNFPMSFSLQHKGIC